MKKTLVLGATLATVIASVASPAFAAAKHRAPVAEDTSGPYAYGANASNYSRPADTVEFGNRVVGEDPDPGIRTQLLHDPVASEY